jgi:hypothetical protein
MEEDPLSQDPHQLMSSKKSILSLCQRQKLPSIHSLIFHCPHPTSLSPAPTPTYTPPPVSSYITTTISSTSTMPQHPPPHPSSRPTYNPHISKTMPWTCCRCRYTQSTYVVTCNGCRHSSCRGCIYHSREFARCAASTGDVDVMNHTDTVDSATAILEIAEKACFANASPPWSTLFCP